MQGPLLGSSSSPRRNKPQRII